MKASDRSATWLCAAVVAILAPGCADILGFEDAKPFIEDAGGTDAPDRVDSDAGVDTGDSGASKTDDGGADALRSDALLDSSSVSDGLLVDRAADGGGCGDTANDPKNCGTCRHDCTSVANVGVPANIQCVASKCVLPGSACGSGYGDCNGNPDDGCETNLSDPQTCGSCNTKCTVAEPLCSKTSSGPKCTTVCQPPAKDQCVSTCVDLQSDRKNCGTCGHDCTALPNVFKDAAGIECRVGACYVPPVACSPGFAHCSMRPDDGCEAELSNARTCGSCDKACSGATPNCATTPTGKNCIMTCPANTPQICGSTCVDLQSNPKNCGSCGHDCTALPHVGPASNVTCSAGKCVVPGTACQQGFDHCTVNADDGCETDVTKSDHCRACGTKCSADKPLCGLTGCTACPPGLRPCNGGCVDPSVDPSCGGYLMSEGFCMIKTGGTVWCWALGSLTTNVSQVPGLASVVQVSGGLRYGCALKSDGSVWCWSDAPPTDVSYGMKFRSVLSGGRCAIDVAEKVYCLTGTEWNLMSSSLLATHLAVDNDGSGEDTFARARDGTIWHWNQPTSGSPALLELGGTYAQVEKGQHAIVLRTTAGAILYNQVPITGAAFAGATFTEVAAGLEGGCALASDGRVACWGYGAYGQLGNGTFQDSATMVQFGGANFRASEVARGGLKTCALKLDGTVWCAGNGILAGPDTSDTATPVQLNVVVP